MTGPTRIPSSTSGRCCQLLASLRLELSRRRRGSLKKKKGSHGASKGVLGTYKKIGTTFVPPMVHRVGPWTYVSWSRQTMPELIWWDVLSDCTSHRFAAQVAEEIAKYFKLRDN